MRGANAVIATTRPSRAGVSTPINSVLSARLQPLSLDLTVDTQGVESHAVMTVPFGSDIQPADQLVWGGRTWSVRTVQPVYGRGTYIRCMLVAVRQ